MKKTSFPLAFLTALALLGGGCSTNTQGDSATPVYLTCEFTLLPAVKNVLDNARLAKVIEEAVSAAAMSRASFAGLRSGAPG